MGQLAGGQVIEGGPVIPDAIPRHVNPFGQTRRVQSDAIQAAVDASSAGDYIYLDPAVSYTENVVISTSGLTLIGLGARGQPWINPASGGGLQIDEADDTVLINVGIGGDSAADYALNIKAAAECRLYGCNIEGPDGTLILLDGTDSAQISNLMLVDCEWKWGGTGIEFDNSLYGYPTQIHVIGGLMHNLTVAAMADNATGGGVQDLWVKDVTFAAQEDGTEPTKYLDLVNVANTGMFSGCRFATATNAASTLAIDAGIFWAANATEAGWSTGRPS
jgi:hypothetical protein